MSGKIKKTVKSVAKEVGRVRDDLREGVGVYTGRQQRADEAAVQAEADRLKAAEEEREAAARRRREGQLRGALIAQPSLFELLGGGSTLG